MCPKVPTNLPITLVRATRAESDEALLKSWLGSAHTQRNFEVTARPSWLGSQKAACASPPSRMCATPSAT
jgi:hypothetical protein